MERSTNRQLAGRGELGYNIDLAPLDLIQLICLRAY
jgi:hypothetical protein